MLTFEQRNARYLDQTGRNALTARQRRRALKKERGQMPEAIGRREDRATVRLAAMLRRKARLAGLTPAS